MNQIVLSDGFLKKAVEIAHERWVNSYPDPEECAHEYPKGFYESILREEKRKNRFKSIARRAAVIFISILIGAAILIAVNPDVRAVVRGWFLELFDGHAVYHFTEDSTLSSLPQYILSYIPDNFEEIDRFVEANRCITVYMNNDTDQMFTFEYNISQENNHIEFYSFDESSCVTINGLIGYYYSSTEDSTNSLIWFNKENNTMFTISSNLEQSVVLDIAEHVNLEESTN